MDSACVLMTFEGLGYWTAIPQFEGISMPNWLSIPEAHTQGAVSGEPSPVTVAFWYSDETANSTQSILIPNGASSVSLYYAASFPVTLTAYDASGAQLVQVSGAANFDWKTDAYDIWSPLEVDAPAGKTIVQLTVKGYSNLTAIDDLKVCQATGIDSVEITQAIQQYQTLSDLKTSLQENGEPPVPIISGKPAVLRVYFREVDNAPTVTVRLSGVTNPPQVKTMVLAPKCPPKYQRSGEYSCQSMDFYFTPPRGTWQATLDLLGDSGVVLNQQVLNVTSRETKSIRLAAVSICDANDATTGNWLCANAADLMGKAARLSKIAPTNLVWVDVTPDLVQEDAKHFGSAFDWWQAAIADVAACYGLWGAVEDFIIAQYTIYFGAVRPQHGAIAGTAPPNLHAGAAMTSVTRLGVQATVEVVAQVAAHALGLKNTNTGVPVATARTPPGCLDLAPDATTDWPFQNNYIQSAAGLEYGFDVAGHRIIDPTLNFELMGYCVPLWISPLRYKTLITALGGGRVYSPSAKAEPEALPREVQPRASASPAKFWQVGGVMQNGAVQFRPLFQVTIQGDTAQGAGTYSLLELDSGGNPLFTRLFTPSESQALTEGEDVVGPPAFSQAIPVTAGAAAIVVRDPNSLEIGRITLGGTAPTVTVTTPAAGAVQSGTQTISWTISNLNGANSTSRVLYSANAGATWSGLGEVTNATSLAVNFDALPGAGTGVIQVLVSDGVNTGSAISGLFSVPRKTPIVAIETPLPDAAQPAADPVYLSGSAYDPEDGMLSGAALVWSSNLQGQLGTGSPLSVSLNPGTHTIELKATDSDRNSVSTTVTVTIGGQAPVVGIQTSAVDSPTTCENVTVTAQPGQSGAPLSAVQVSVDGGASYQALSLTALPFTFLSPGSGFVHVVARAYDTSGQAGVQDATFLTKSACQKEACDIDGNFTTNILDVQQIINEVLGRATAADDLNRDGKVTVVEAQMVINAATGKTCGG